MSQKVHSPDSVSSHAGLRDKSFLKGNVANFVLANDKMSFLLLPLSGIIFSPIYLTYIFLHIFSSVRNGESKLVIFGQQFVIEHLNSFYDDLRQAIREKVNGDINRCQYLLSLFSLGVGMGLAAIGIICLQYTLVPLALSLVIPEIMACASVGVKLSICLFISGSILMPGLIRVQKSLAAFQNNPDLNVSKQEKLDSRSVDQLKSMPGAKRSAIENKRNIGSGVHSEKKIQ